MDGQEFVRARLNHYILERSLIKGFTISKQPPAIILDVQQEVSCTWSDCPPSSHAIYT
jgi:hypothetical protein